MSGLAPVQVPKSRVEVVVVAVVEVEVVESVQSAAAEGVGVGVAVVQAGVGVGVSEQSDAEVEVVEVLVLPAATAASISAAVTSGTRRFWVKMQPFGSLASSQVLPAAVGSPMVPGAKVPLLMASWGSPPMEAICTARSRAICLLVAAAPVEAGS